MQLSQINTQYYLEILNRNLPTDLSIHSVDTQSYISVETLLKQFYSTDARFNISEMFEANPSALWISLNKDNHVIGLANLHFIYRENGVKKHLMILLRQFVIHKDFRGQNYGRKFLMQIQKLCDPPHEKNVLWLVCKPHLVDFYKRCNFNTCELNVMSYN